MKLEEFDTSRINDFVNREIDSFSEDTTLNSHVKYIYSVGCPKREKTYLMTQIGQAVNVSEISLLPFAAAAELMMASAMNADDSCDDSKTRYGGKALWTTLGKDKAHIISGYMYGLLFEILKKHRLETPDKQKEYTELIDLAQDYFFTMHHAQYRTLSLGDQLGNFDLKKLDELALQKTSPLFDFCAVAPAILAKKYVPDMREFGRTFGVALQYASDIRDFVKKEKDIDKPDVRWEDFYTHQPNLTLVLAAQSDNLTREERSYFVDIWSNTSEPSPEIEDRAMELIRKSNAIPESREVLSRLGKKLEDKIDLLPNPQIRDDLANLISRICYI